MASLIQTGTNAGLLRYIDDNSININIVIAHITDYSRGGTGRINISTSSGSYRLDLGGKPAVDTAIALLNSIF